MSFYKVALGFDVPDIDLVLIDPQPTSDGVQTTRRTHSANATIFGEGRYIELRWAVVEDESILDDILSVFGLDGADTTSEVTIHVPQPPIMAYNYFNGIAVRPEIGPDLRRRDYFLRDLVVLVKFLELAA